MKKGILLAWLVSWCVTASVQAAPYVILKFDDLECGTRTGFKAATDLAKSKGVRVGVGLYTGQLEYESPCADGTAYVSYLNSLFADPEAEVWFHSISGVQSEFVGLPLSTQQGKFAGARKLILSRFDSLMRTYGPHWAAGDSNTAYAFNNDPFFKVWLLWKDALPVQDTTHLWAKEICGTLETGDTPGNTIPFATYKSNFEANGCINKEVIVIEGHGTAYSDASKRAILGQVIDYLKGQGAVFIHAFDYYKIKNGITDTSAPAAPTGLTLSRVNAQSIKLTWPAAADAQSGIDGYKIYRNGVFVDIVTGLTYTDAPGTSLPDSTSYQISAINKANLVSAKSLAASLSAPTEDPTQHCIRAGAPAGGDGTTWAKAWQDLPSSLVRGHTYYMAAGTYSGRTFNDAETGSVITIKKATISDHGSSTGWPVDNNYALGQAVFGPVAFTKGSYLLDGGSRTDWKSGHGIKIDNYPYVSDTIVSIGDYNRTSVDNITLRYVEVEGSHSRSTPNDRGIQVLWNSDNFLAQYCYVHDVGNCPFFFRGSQNSKIEYSFITRNNYTAAIHSEGISASEGTNNFTVRFNIWEDIVGTCAIGCPSAGHSALSNWYIYGNIFYWTPGYKNLGGTLGFGNGILAIWDADFAGDLVFYNNTIVNINSTYAGGWAANAGLDFGMGSPTTAQRYYIKNNLWMNCTRVDGLAVTGTAPVDLQWTHNAYFQTTTGDGDANKQVSSADPFTNTSVFDFHLKTQTTSGVNLGSPFNLDLDGQTRANWSRGAYEFGGTTPPVFVYHPADTNPQDKIISLNEATKYGACWKNPAAFGDCPTGIAIDYAVRAGTLWAATANGQYQYNSANACPLCWEIKP